MLRAKRRSVSNSLGAEHFKKLLSLCSFKCKLFIQLLLWGLLVTMCGVRRHQTQYTQQLAGGASKATCALLSHV